MGATLEFYQSQQHGPLVKLHWRQINIIIKSCIVPSQNQSSIVELVGKDFSDLAHAEKADRGELQ